MPETVNAWLIATLKSRRKTPGVAVNSLVQTRRVNSRLLPPVSVMACSAGQRRGLDQRPLPIRELCDQKNSVGVDFPSRAFYGA